MTIPDPPAKVVEVLEDEYGDVGWVDGHIDPALAVLSLVIERMQNVGAEEAMDTILGGRAVHPQTGRVWTYTDQTEWANKVIASVRHVWLVQDPENEEMMHNAKEGDPGALPFTRIEIPA